MNDLQTQILEVTSSGYPLLSVYTVCKKLGNPQHGSRSKFYVRVYRAMEALVEQDKMVVMRGTRDPSVYFNMNRLTK